MQWNKSLYWPHWYLWRLRVGVCWRDRGSSADDRRSVGLGVQVECYLLLCISENRLSARLKGTWQRAAAEYYDEKPKQTRESWHNTAYRHITHEGARRQEKAHVVHTNILLLHQPCAFYAIIMTGFAQGQISMLTDAENNNNDSSSLA